MFPPLVVIRIGSRLGGARTKFRAGESNRETRDTGPAMALHPWAQPRVGRIRATARARVHGRNASSAPVLLLLTI